MVRKKEARRKVAKFEVVPTRIYVKDFGPVAKADIELKPLTVLMGPNNTGKTYMSTLLLIADNIIKFFYFYHILPKIIRDTPNVSDFVKQNLEEGFVRLYSASNLGELVKRGRRFWSRD
jgi:predicted ATPase